MRAGRAILQNFFNLSAGEAIARLVNFAAFAHLARVLGRGEFGWIGFVMTVVTYLLIPVLQGFDSVGIRDVARDRDRLRTYAGGILAIRLLSALLTYAGLFAVVRLVAPAPPMPALVLLFGLTLFPGALSLKWAFQAVEQNRPVAAANVVAQLVFAAGAFTVRGPEQLLLIPLYSLAGESAGAAVLLGTFLARFGWFRLVFERRFWKELFRESTPLAVSSILGTLLFNFDILALARFRGASAVGVYTAVYKLVLLFATLLTLFQLSLFPTLSRAYADGRKLEEIAGRVLHFVAAAFVPLAFAGPLLARPLLVFLFGPEYAAGAATLAILMWSLPFMALRSVFRIILVSYNHQRLDLRAVLAGTITNVGLDLALAPPLGTVGTAISTLSSEVVIFVMSYRYIWRRVEPVSVWRHCVRPAAASLVMFLALWLLAAAPLAARVAAAGIVYLAALVLLRGLHWKEIAALYRG
ncbi:MAG TPA: flippase [Bryobacterales bacterium]|nr:flippase [Bryobacterales bacterium]